MKKFCIFLFLLFSLSSCFSRKTNYYMLDYKDNPNKKEISCEIPSNFIIQVGPVEILDYLKRDQVIIKEGDNKIRISDRDLWITSLDNQIKSVLKLGLSKYVTTDSNFKNKSVEICEYPCMNLRDGKERLKLTLSVNSFEYDKSLDKVLFNGMLKLYFNNNLLDSKVINFTDDLSSSSYEEITKSMSEVLGKLVKSSVKMICKNN